MTPKQRKVYDFILDFYDANGFSPNYQEICDAVGFQSRSGVFGVVNALVERGLVTRTPFRSRSLIPTERLAVKRLEGAAKYVSGVIRSLDRGDIAPAEAVDAMRLVPGMLRGAL